MMNEKTRCNTLSVTGAPVAFVRGGKKSCNFVNFSVNFKHF